MAYNPYSSLTVTSPFGGDRNHHGIDYAMNLGDYIYSVTIGKVVEAVEGHSIYGNYVTIDNGSGYTFKYAHMDSINVKTGDTVAPATIIGKAGSTGNSTGPHLHLEVKKGSEFIDPDEYFTGTNTRDTPGQSPGTPKAGYIQPQNSGFFSNDLEGSENGGFTSLIIGFYFVLLFAAGFFAFSKIKDADSKEPSKTQV